MKLLKKHIALAAVITAAVQAQAEVILSTDFTGSTAHPNTTEASVAGFVSNITWVVNGVTDPGAITVDIINPDSGNTLFTSTQAEERIAVDNNVGNGGSWAASINTTLDGSGDVTLTAVTIGFRTYNASGDYNAGGRAINWAIEIINTTSSTSRGSISADSAVVPASPQPTDGSITLIFSAPIILTGTDAYEFRVIASEVTGGSDGVHTGINDITFSSGLAAPTAPLNLYAWPDSNNVVSVYWDEEIYSTDGYNVYRSLEDTGDYTQIASGVTNTFYVDAAVTNGITYYYKVVGVNAAGEGEFSSSEYAMPNPYRIIGTTGSNVEKSMYELFDGDISTVGVVAESEYVGLDYGLGNEQELLQMRYYLRTDYWGSQTDANGLTRAVNRSIGFMLQGANSEDFSDAVTLYTFTSNSVMGAWNEITVANSTPFRYVRLQSGGSFDIINTLTELEFFKASDYTARGTPLYWLEGYGLTDADDELDSDGDGLAGWEEYIAGTVPTNSSSLLEVNSIELTTNGVVLSWQSVPNKIYSIITNTSLSVANKGTAVSGIIADSAETSVTSSIPSAASVFFEIGVE
ncbi:fibronectin type III domain-containing protein [Pontiellaceae bacterium B1224]|nr:fibronectin type III domain-containing protein [Pontiellaceae bacterium B1224]